MLLMSDGPLTVPSAWSPGILLAPAGLFLLKGRARRLPAAGAPVQVHRARDRVQLVVIAYQAGLVRPAPPHPRLWSDLD